MYCNKCGKEISGDPTFCIYCGNEIIRTDEEKKQVRFCRKCGSELSEKAVFCRKCGERIGVTETEFDLLSSVSPAVTTDSTKVSGGAAAVRTVKAVKAVKTDNAKKSLSNRTVGIIAVVIFVLIIAAVVFVITHHKSEAEKIADAFENTFGADSYKCSLTSYDTYGGRIDPDADNTIYIERCKEDDETLFYYYAKNHNGHYYKNAYDDGVWYMFDEREKAFVEYDSRYSDSKSCKNSKKVINKDLYSILLTNNNFMNETLYMRDNYCYLNKVIPRDGVPALKSILEEYFKDNKKVDCIENFKKNGDSYSLRINYGELIKTLDLDYKKDVDKNFIRMIADETSEAYNFNYFLDVDFKIKNGYVEKLDILLLMEQIKGSGYAKIGKWKFKFEDVNELKPEDCKAAKAR